MIAFRLGLKKAARPFLCVVYDIRWRNNISLKSILGDVHCCLEPTYIFASDTVNFTFSWILIDLKRSILSSVGGMSWSMLMQTGHSLLSVHEACKLTRFRNQSICDSAILVITRYWVCEFFVLWEWMSILLIFGIPNSFQWSMLPWHANLHWGKRS